MPSPTGRATPTDTLKTTAVLHRLAFHTPLPVNGRRLTSNASRHLSHRHAKSARRLIPKRATSLRIVASASDDTDDEDDARRDDDLLIIGAGDLGYLVGLQWRALHPHATITAETRTTRHHARLQTAGLTPILYDGDSTTTMMNATTKRTMASNVVFCLPPPKISNYLDLVSDAIENRLASALHSRFVFTSSTSVHAADEACITEVSPGAVTKRALLLLQAERLALQVPMGSVLRFSGLYSLRRGAHAFWVQAGLQRVSERRTANLLHRVDAAAAVVQLLQLQRWPNGLAGDSAGDSDSDGDGDGDGVRKTFLAAAEDAVTGRQIVDAMRMHPEYEGRELPTLFADRVERRECDSSWTRAVLGWKPRWESFVDFMAEDGERVRQGLPSGRAID